MKARTVQPEVHIQNLQRELKKVSSPAKAKVSSWFFKTGPGEYGEGDQFIGVTVPEQRKIAKKFQYLPLKQIELLLKSLIHEHRFTALEILVMQYDRARDDTEREKLVRFYLRHTRWVNNWDLVDTSAPYILGAWFLYRPKNTLYALAHSNSVWERRMAIIATQTFIRNGQFADTLKIARLLRNDTHDLIQKAVGWMLREVGERNRPAEEAFLRRWASQMPRTMLRYAIEKFPSRRREHYLRQGR